jgi:hypothetical protein
MPQMTQEIIRAAIAGFEEQKRHIDDEIAELRAMLPGSNSRTDGNTPRATKGRRGMSAEGRARIAEAQRKRWAMLKGESGPATSPSTKQKRKRRPSAAGRANIVAALKKRWALKRVEGGKAQSKTSPRKKSAAKRAGRKAAAKAAPAATETTA